MGSRSEHMLLPVAIDLTLVEEPREGPGLNPGGISGSANAGHGTKRKLSTKTYTQKYEAIMEVEKGQKTKKQIAAELSVPQNTLSTWIKSKEQIKERYLTGSMEPERKRSRGAKYPEVENALLSWFRNARSNNIPIGGCILRRKAREFAEQLGLTTSEFECSSGWLQRFKQRNCIVYTKVSGESDLADTSSFDLTVSEFTIKEESINVDTSVPYPETHNGCDILGDLISGRAENATHSSDHEEAEDGVERKGSNPITVKEEEEEKKEEVVEFEGSTPITANEAMSLYEKLRSFFEMQDGAEEAMKSLDIVERFVTRKYIESVSQRQATIKSFFKPL